MAGGSITVSNGAGDTLSVTITGGTWKAAADLSGSNVTFPDEITESKTYYTGTDVPGAVISVLRNGVEIANTPDGTRTVNINDGKSLSFVPSSDPEKRISPAEMSTLFQSAITPEPYIELSDAVATDEDEEARAAIQEIIDALVEVGILEAPSEEE